MKLKAIGLGLVVALLSSFVFYLDDVRTAGLRMAIEGLAWVPRLARPRTLCKTPKAYGIIEFTSEWEQSSSQLVPTNIAVGFVAIGEPFLE